MIRKNKTAFQPSLAPKGMLSSILAVKLANDMPAYQFEATKDLLNTAKICYMETQQKTLISYAINFKKVWRFKLFYCQF